MRKIIIKIFQQKISKTYEKMNVLLLENISENGRKIPKFMYTFKYI